MERVPPDILTDDKRLDAKVTLTRRRAPSADVLADLTEQTHVPLAVPDGELAAMFVTVAVRDLPLRDLLRSLAQQSRVTWKRGTGADGRPALILAEPDGLLWQFLRPRTAAEADRNRAMDAFVGQIQAAPPATRQALAGWLPFARLPAGAQDALRDMIRAQGRVDAALPGGGLPLGPNAFTVDNVAGSRVRLRAKPIDGGTDYTVDAVLDGLSSGIGCAATLPDDPASRSLLLTVAPPGSLPAFAAEQKALVDSFTDSRAAALKSDPRFRTPVSLTMDIEAPVGFALAALAPVGVVNVTGVPGEETYRLSFSAIPLGEALDRIAAKYHGMWGVSREGVVLFHRLRDPNATANPMPRRPQVMPGSIDPDYSPEP